MMRFYGPSPQGTDVSEHVRSLRVHSTTVALSEQEDVEIMTGDGGVKRGLK